MQNAIHVIFVYHVVYQFQQSARCSKIFHFPYLDRQLLRLSHPASLVFSPEHACTSPKAGPEIPPSPGPTKAITASARESPHSEDDQDCFDCFGLCPGLTTLYPSGGEEMEALVNELPPYSSDYASISVSLARFLRRYPLSLSDPSRGSFMLTTHRAAETINPTHIRPNPSRPIGVISFSLRTRVIATTLHHRPT